MSRCIIQSSAISMPGLSTCVVAPHSSKGAVTAASSLQSDVRQTRSDRSSDWLARYFPTGSNTTPFTRPV